jgi:hypothetical protein
MDDDRLEHLKMIQAVIARLAQNSFLVKGWSVTLVTAVMALTLRDSNKGFVLLALYPAIVFWGLDAYYLRQERLFRKLYDSVRGPAADPAAAFSMDTSQFDETVQPWLCTLFASTVVPLHGMVVLLVAIVVRLAK